MIAKVSPSKEYRIPPALAAELEKIPDYNIPHQITPTAEERAVIKACFRTKKQEKFIAWFRAKYGWGSMRTIRKFYNEEAGAAAGS